MADHPFDEAFAGLFYKIAEDAYERLPEESDDSDIRAAAEAAVDAADQQGLIDWSTVREAVLQWTDPDNSFTRSASLPYLPEGYQTTVEALPAGTPADKAPYREALVVSVIAHLNVELDEADTEDAE